MASWSGYTPWHSHGDLVTVLSWLDWLEMPYLPETVKTTKGEAKMKCSSMASPVWITNKCSKPARSKTVKPKLLVYVEN
jgi:hypothetical protein